MIDRKRITSSNSICAKKRIYETIHFGASLVEDNRVCETPKVLKFTFVK